MDRKTKGRLAEAKVLSFLIENGYEVYLPFSNNSKYDVIAYKDGVVKRISIKFTSTRKPSGTWTVEMRQIFRGNNKITIHKFDRNEFDIVAVYIGPEDKIVLIDAADVRPRSLQIKKVTIS
jgi:Holliday junction resolvase